MKTYYLAIIIILYSFFACEDKDKLRNGLLTPPLTEYNIEPINGGAIISYTIPKDPNILYVLAEYERNGRKFTEKSSIYLNTMTIEGFDTQEKVDVKLYTLNRKEEKSLPLTIDFVPLESPLSLTNKSLKIFTAFGGIDVLWENPAKIELGLKLMVKEENGDLIDRGDYYSASAIEKYPFRGFADSVTTFVVFFEDKWGNTSDTTYLKTTPYFETEIKKPFRDMRAQIPYDNVSDLGSRYQIGNLWDNIVGDNNGFITATGSLSTSITIDLKQVVQLSRMTYWARWTTYGQVFGQVNARIFEVYGTKKLDPSRLPPASQSYWLHEWSVRNGIYKEIPKDYVLPDVTFEDEWQYLGIFDVPRQGDFSPSDPAIADIAINGNRYELPIDVEPVRYIRIVVHEANNYPVLNNYFGMGELSFFGDNSVPQE